MTPVPASSVLVLRSGGAGMEVLMGRRRETLFFGGAWVFPGGAVDEADRDPVLTGAGHLPDGPWRAAALRETAEEVGLLVTDVPVEMPEGPVGADVYRVLRDAGARFLFEELAYVSNWVTPVGVSRRFDTRFFALAVPPGTDPGHVASEFDRVAWVSPGEALARFADGDMEMILPTIKHLEFLAGCADPADVIARTRGQDVVPQIEPRVRRLDGRVEVLLPGEPGYEEPAR